MWKKSEGICNSGRLMSRKTNRLSVVSLPIGFNRKSPIEMGCYCYCHCFIPRNFNRKLFFFLLLPNNRPIMNFTDSCFHAIISFLIFTLISFRHWFLLQFNVLFVDMKATKNCLSSLEFLGKLYDFVVVSMDEEKKAKFENEEKINPFGSMNQINLDVDFFSPSLTNCGWGSMEMLQQFCFFNGWKPNTFRQCGCANQSADGNWECHWWISAECEEMFSMSHHLLSHRWYVNRL